MIKPFFNTCSFYIFSLNKTTSKLEKELSSLTFLMFWQTILFFPSNFKLRTLIEVWCFVLISRDINIENQEILKRKILNKFTIKRSTWFPTDEKSLSMSSHDIEDYLPRSQNTLGTTFFLPSIWCSSEPYRVFSPSLVALTTRRFHFYEKRAEAACRVNAPFCLACMSTYMCVCDSVQQSMFF